MTPPTQPGRELDAWLAVKLFGFEITDNSHPIGVLISRNGRIDVLPRLSITWEGAGLVEEAMGKRGFWLMLKSPFRQGEPYFAGFTPQSESGWNGEPDFTANFKHAPAAVALAAVEAIQAEGQ